jgi:hypothetical protein
VNSLGFTPFFSCVDAQVGSAGDAQYGRVLTGT